MCGWVKLHRTLLEHPRFRDPDWLAVWVFLLLKATHQRMERVFGGRRIWIEAGQLITSRKSISDATGVHESKVERVLKWMLNEHQIEQRSDRQCRLINLTNWRKYQHEAPSAEHRAEQGSDHDRTTLEQRADTHKKVEEWEEGKKHRRTHSPFSIPSLEDFTAYASEIGLPVNEAEKAHDYYTSNGWKTGRNQMRDWRSALRNWNRRQKEYEGGSNAVSRQAIDRNAGTLNQQRSAACITGAAPVVRGGRKPPGV